MSKESKLREQIWYGVPFKQALQDVVARHQTGYSYKELLKEIETGDDLLEEAEIDEVDKMVNILAHLFVFYHSYRPEEVSSEKIESVYEQQAKEK